MQLPDLGKRSITTWERMQEIEGELFLLSARSVELDFEDGHQFERLYRERTQLAIGCCLASIGSRGSTRSSMSSMRSDAFNKPR
jgi:hypothetical protein